MSTHYSISQIQYAQNSRTHKVALLVESIQKLFVRVLQEAYSALLPLDEEMLGPQIASMVLYTYKTLTAIYGDRIRTGFRAITRNHHVYHLKEASNQAVSNRIKQKKRQTSLIRRVVTAVVDSRPTRYVKVSYAFHKIRLHGNSETASHLEELKYLSLRRLGARLQYIDQTRVMEVFLGFVQQGQADIQELITSKMTVIIKRHFTKLYIKSTPKEPLQIKRETMARLYEYLGRVRRNENVMRHCCNLYTVSRYVQISRAFLKIKGCLVASAENLPSQSVLRTLETVNASNEAFQAKLHCRKLSSILQKRLRMAFLGLKSFRSCVPVAPGSSEFKFDSPIFSNSLVQYLYLLGHLPSEVSSNKRRSTTILKLLLKRSSVNTKEALHRYFQRFKELIPNYNFQQRLLMLKHQDTLERRKDELIAQYD